MSDNYAKGIYRGYLYNQAGEPIVLVEVTGKPGRYPRFVEFEGRVYAEAALRGWREVVAVKATRTQHRDGDPLP